VIEIRLQLEEKSRETKVILDQLNIAGATLTVNDFDPNCGFKLVVKDKEAIKALADAVSRGKVEQPT